VISFFEWNLKYGDRIKFFKSAQSRGKRTALDDMPVYDFSYDWYVNAYSIIRYSKNESGHIPLSEILAYANNFDLIGTKEEFVRVIRSLDITENKHFSEKEEKEKESKEKNQHKTNVKVKR